MLAAADLEKIYSHNPSDTPPVKVRYMLCFAFKDSP